MKVALPTIEVSDIARRGIVRSLELDRPIARRVDVRRWVAEVLEHSIAILEESTADDERQEQSEELERIQEETERKLAELGAGT